MKWLHKPRSYFLSCHEMEAKSCFRFDAPTHCVETPKRKHIVHSSIKTVWIHAVIDHPIHAVIDHASEAIKSSFHLVYVHHNSVASVRNDCSCKVLITVWFCRCLVILFQKRSTHWGIGHHWVVHIQRTNTWIQPLVTNALSCSSHCMVSSQPSLKISKVFLLVLEISKRCILSRVASTSCVPCLVRLRWSTHARKVEKSDVSCVNGRILCDSPAKIVNPHLAAGIFIRSSLIFSFAYVSLERQDHISSTSILCDTSSIITISWLFWSVSAFSLINHEDTRKQRKEQKKSTDLHNNKGE